MLATAISGLVPVEVVPETPRIEAAGSASVTATETPGVIEVTFPAGAKLRVSGGVDMAVLRSVLAELRGR